MDVKKLAGLIAIALLIFFVITQPNSAANSLQSIASTLRDWAESVTTFFTEVVE